MSRFARLAFLVAGLAFGSTSLLLADDTPTSKPTSQPASAPVLVNATDNDAVAAAMGQDVFLDGTIDAATWSSSGKVMKATFKDAPKLSVIIFEKKKADFDAAFAGDITKALAGAHVRIAGKLKEFHGAPEIALDQVSQITILEVAPSTEPSK